MDPLSQGVLGASLSQAGSKPRHQWAAGVLGFLAGMAADLDVLIRSPSDPLLFLEYHRQFTHSLIFIPVGGLLCALLLHPLLGRRWHLSWRDSALFCTLGYATHALLDACTTYGTQLLWPFSTARFAWNSVSIIDPLFTLPLLALVVLAARRQRPLFAQLAMLWAISYLLLGVLQRERAEAAGWQLAETRGAAVIRLEAKPSFANLLVWKIVYETETQFFVDAVRVGLHTKFYPGEVVQKLDIARDMPWLDADSQQARDIERFRWFSNGYIARDPQHPQRIIDVRYSIVPNQVSALWSIELTPQADNQQHARYETTRNTDPKLRDAFWIMLLDSKP